VAFESCLFCLMFLLAAGTLTGTLYAMWVSFHEQEIRAIWRVGCAGVLLTLFFVAAAKTGLWLSLPLVVLTFCTGMILWLPWRQRKETPSIPVRCIDERDTIFSRSHLEPGSERFDSYYAANPEKRSLDDGFRAKPGLLKPGSRYFDPHLFAAAEASFSAVAALHSLAEGTPHSQQKSTDALQITALIKQWGLKLGARGVGITGLQDYHLYTHLGRNEPYGQEIVREHEYAIAVTVEMSRQMLDHAPYAPAVMESAQQYFNAGAIAVQLALFIRNLGYPARAHIDGNYQVICPLVARDAGLGEIGRMGLLMTPGLGPRVRLAVVTTNLPLICDAPGFDDTVLDFCRRCEKCATVCPSQAIPYGDCSEKNGVRRWQIDSEACYTYWCSIGTDCGRCVRICPYAHADNGLHNLVRAGVRRSPVARALAVWGDDWLYGKNPKPRPFSGLRGYQG